MEIVIGIVAFLGFLFGAASFAIILLMIAGSSP